MTLSRLYRFGRRLATERIYEAKFDYRVQPTLRFLLSYGFSVDDVRTLFRQEPQLLQLPLSTQLKPVLAFLERSEATEDVFGPALTRRELRRMIQSHPRVLKYSVEGQLRGLFQFWRRDLQLSEAQVHELITHAPLVLGYPLAQLRIFMQFFHNRFADSAEIVQIFAAFPEVLNRPIMQLMQFYDYWKLIEMSDRDFMTMVAGYPVLLKLDFAEVLRPVVEYLVFIKRHRSGARLVVDHPYLFEMPLAELSCKIEYLMQLGIRRGAVFEMLRSHPNILNRDIQRQIQSLRQRAPHLTTERLIELLPQCPELLIEEKAVTEREGICDFETFELQSAKKHSDAFDASFHDRREILKASSVRLTKQEFTQLSRDTPTANWEAPRERLVRSTTRRIVCVDQTTEQTQGLSPEASPPGIPLPLPMDTPEELEAVARSLGLTDQLRPLSLSQEPRTGVKDEILARKPRQSGSGVVYNRTETPPQKSLQSAEVPAKLSKSAKKRQKKKLNKQKQTECMPFPCVQRPETSPNASPVGPRPNNRALLRGLMGATVPRNAVRFCEQGIQNLGNTCFLASALQLLLGSSHFCGLMLEMKTALYVLNPTQYPFISAMGSLAQSLRVQPPIDPQREGLFSGEGLNSAAIAPEMLSPIVSLFQARSKERSVGGQDVQEFLIFILDNLEKEISQLRPALQPDPDNGVEEGDESWMVVGRKKKVTVQRTTGVVESSVLSSIFGGTIESAVRAAGMVASVTTHSFTSLVLDIAPPGVQTVEDALDLYTASDTIPGTAAENEICSKVCVDYRIQGSRGRVMASKSNVFKQLPVCLILCLKQYTYSPSGFEKLHKPIGFGSLLTFKRQWQSSGQSSLDYRLIATCNHHGQGHGGRAPVLKDSRSEMASLGDHYTANVLQRDKRWVHFNDSRLKRTSVSVVLSETPYLLLYERV